MAQAAAVLPITGAARLQLQSKTWRRAGSTEEQSTRLRESKTKAQLIRYCSVLKRIIEKLS